MSILDELVLETREFARHRDWFQHHTPKNLAMAIAGEAGELASEFRWLTVEESSREELTDAQLTAIRYEMADVFIFMLRLSDVLDVNLAAAVREKLAVNEVRFPVETKDWEK
ncbi:MAG TPA: nucleotide pyrophosphohydrolase [Acidimicrobiales bacterium]